MEIAQYVTLCTRLSRFVQLQTLSADDTALLCATCDAFLAFYAKEEQQKQEQSPATTSNSLSLLGGVSSATMDDIVLLTMQKLLLGVVTASETCVKESVFQVLAHVLDRNALKIRAFGEQKLLGFLQSCVLYLPTPDAALDRSNDSEKQRVSKALQIQSEELRLHILTCLQLMLRNRAPDLRLSMGSATPSSGTEQMHFFAYVVSALLHIGEHDRCRPAAQLAVETLALLMDFLHDPVLLRQFFPGVSVGMWKTINAPQQSSKVAVAALRCLAQSLTLCISDAVTQSSSVGSGASSFTIEALRALTQQTGDDKQAAATADSEIKQDAWLQETAVNVDIVLSKLFSSIQVAHKSWRIREALVDLCGTVVLASRVTLRDSFFRCYEELLVLRVDPIREVSASAQRVISTLQDELSTDEWLQMVPVLADRFQMHLSTLSLKCSTDHESASVSLMRKLIGYVSFLGHRLGPYLDASMDAIYTALCRVFEFDAIDIDLVLHQKYIDAVNNVENEEEDDGNGAREKALTTSQFQKRLRFFHEEESVKTATQLLLAIGSVSTPALFIDCAFTLLTSGEDADTMMEERHAEVFLVLNGFLKAYVKTPHGGFDTKDTLLATEASQEQNGVDVHLVGRILEDLLVLDAWSEHLEHREIDGRQLRTRRSLKAAVAQRALMVECVGVCVEILHRDFSIFLLHTLYPLVEKLGSRDVEVEHAALAALHKIYFFCGYASVEALFEANMDYFVDALCSRLEHLEAYPLTALVVEGLLRHTKIASLPLVDEVANSLLQSVDLYQDSPYISSLLRALKLLLSSVTASAGTFEKTERQECVEIGGPMAREQTDSLLSQFIKEIRILNNEKIGYENDELDSSAPLDASKQDTQEDTNDEARMKGAMPVEYDERSALDGPREEDDDDQREKDAQGSSSRYTALVVEILDRSGHFLSESEPIACCLVLSIIEEGVLLLRASRKELLPLIHRLWGSLLYRLEVPNKPIVTATIRLVRTLALVAGDFIGERFVENVWPVLRKHLRGMELLTEKKSGRTQLTRSMLLLDSRAQVASETSDLRAEQQKEPTTQARHRRTQDSQLLVAALECLATVCNKSSAVTFIVPEVAATTKKYLSAHLPLHVVHASKRLFAALAELNGDEVFCTLAPLADWTPPRPPSARFPAFTADATRQFYKPHGGGATTTETSSAASREHAACLIRQLVRHQ